MTKGTLPAFDAELLCLRESVTERICNGETRFDSLVVHPRGDKIDSFDSSDPKLDTYRRNEGYIRRWVR